MNNAIKLKAGDSIGIFSPSSPITYTCPKRFIRAKKYLQDRGFNIIEGKLTGKHDFYRSGTIKERADELNSLIRNPEIKKRRYTFYRRLPKGFCNYRKKFFSAKSKWCF